MADRAPRPRVLLVANSLEPGGAERQLIELATRLPADRFEVHMALLQDPSGLGRALAARGIPTTSLGFVRPVRAGRAGSLARVVNAFAVIGAAVIGSARFVVHARRGGYALVDAWLWHGYVLATLTRGLTGIPVVVAGRRSLVGFKAGFGRPRAAVDRAVTRRSDAIVANSEAVRRDVIEREGVAAERIRVIRNGVTIPPPDRPGREALRRTWGIADDRIVVGCVANLRPGKGHDVLLDAAARLRERQPAVRWVLVGDGPVRSAVEAGVGRLGLSGTVRLLGSVPDAAPLHAGFDIAVHASEAEGLSNAVLEAAAAGLPIVATGVGGVPEIVSDEETGLLVPARDAEALAAAVERLVADPQLGQRLGAAARSLVAERHSWEAMIVSMAGLYQELIADRTGNGRPLSRGA